MDRQYGGQSRGTRPGAVACELSLTLENIRDLRDEFQAELDRKLGL